MQTNTINNRLNENLLEPFASAAQTLSKRKFKPLVTIVSSLVCKNAILMASDSRTTNEDGTVRDDTTKIHIITMADDFTKFVVGQSGHDDLGARAIEILANMARTSSMNDYRAVADLAAKAVSALKDEIWSQFRGTPEELQKHFENHNFDLMLAHYYQDGNGTTRPLIFTLRFSLGTARLQNKNFVSIGCGSPIADFILDGFNVSELNFSAAMATAIYVVEQVKKFDPRCGGRTQIASAEKFFEDKASIYSATLIDGKLVDDYSQAVVEIGAEFRTSQIRMMSDITTKVQKFIAPRVAKIKSEGGIVHFGFGGSIEPGRPPDNE
jgi:20S proteasome alpha/beta subunit